MTALRTTHIINYLEAAGYSVYPNPNFIPGTQLETLYPCLFVFDTGGEGPHGYVPTEKPTYQIIIKGKSYKADPANMAATEDIAYGLVHLLHRKCNYMVGSSEVLTITAIGRPHYIGLDEQDHPVYSTNFQFYVKEE